MDVPTLVIIAVIVVVFIVVGPKKIPELARALGMAKKEFNDGVQSQPSVTPTQARDGDDLMIAARKLGISTEGKTRDEISAEVLRKTANS